MTGGAGLIAIGVVFFTFVILAIRQIEIDSDTWRLLTSGIYDHVEYGWHKETKRSGAMVHTTRTVRMEDTIVHFADGRTVVLGGRRDMQFTKGQIIDVYENGLGGRCIRAQGEKP